MDDDQKTAVRQKKGLRIVFIVIILCAIFACGSVIFWYWQEASVYPGAVKYGQSDYYSNHVALKGGVIFYTEVRSHFHTNDSLEVVSNHFRKRGWIWQDFALIEIIPPLQKGFYLPDWDVLINVGPVQLLVATGITPGHDKQYEATVIERVTYFSFLYQN